MNQQKETRKRHHRPLTWLVALTAMGMLTAIIGLAAVGAATASRLHRNVDTPDIIDWIIPPPLRLWQRLAPHVDWPPPWLRGPGNGGMPNVTPEQLAPSVSTPLSARPAEENLVADVAEQVLPSVVNISTSRVVRSAANSQLTPFSSDPMLQWFFHQSATPHQAPREQLQRSLGSGVIVSSDGLILTNHHVVDKADEIRVTLYDGHELRATVVGSDSHTDLALLRLEGDDLPSLPPLPLGESNDLRLGQLVLAVGNPFGLSGSVTMGIVSAKGRSGMGIADYEDFIQTDAAINPGNSGGALVSLDGELVGINTAIVSRTGGNQGIGFAIPSSMARTIMDELVEHGEVSRGYLGVYIQDLDTGLAEAMDLDGNKGALVAQVADGSPADLAGVQVGDLVVSLDGKSIESADALRTSVALHAPGTRITLSMVRAGESVSSELELGELQDETGMRELSTGADDPLQGLSVQALSASNRRELGISASLEHGLVVIKVVEGSRAWQAGLRQHDVLLEANRKPLIQPGELRAALQGEGSHLLLTVWRRGAAQFVAVPKG